MSFASSRILLGNPQMAESSKYIISFLNKLIKANPRAHPQQKGVLCTESLLLQHIPSKHLVFLLGKIPESCLIPKSVNRKPPVAGGTISGNSVSFLHTKLYLLRIFPEPSLELSSISSQSSQGSASPAIDLFQKLSPQCPYRGFSLPANSSALLFPGHRFSANYIGFSI